LIVADLPRAALAATLSGPGLRLRTGPVVTQIQSTVASVVDGIALHYAQHSIEDVDGFADFHVQVRPPANLRRWVAPQLLFDFDGMPPFRPLPRAQAFPMLEWGLNWCVSSYAHQYLIFHAAVIEQHGRALILPAPPGSGKSTLCAGLIHRGWRLLSDELTLLEPLTLSIVPLARPVSLKNVSIDVIREFSAEAAFGPIVKDTIKGAVAHMKPPVDSVRRANEKALPRWIVWPRYEAGAQGLLVPWPKSRSFMRLAENAFNAAEHGKTGFEAMANLIDRCECYEFVYSDLEHAANVFAALARQE